MKVTMLLADHVEAVQGKLYILGGGWSITGPGPTLMGIALKIEVPWDQANMRHRMRLALLDADGNVVQVPGPAGDQNVEIQGEFEAGRPPGLLPGTPLDAVLAINLGPLQLEPGTRYMWRLWINDRSQDDWYVTFSTRPAKTR